MLAVSQLTNVNMQADRLNGTAACVDAPAEPMRKRSAGPRSATTLVDTAERVMGASAGMHPA